MSFANTTAAETRGAARAALVAIAPMRMRAVLQRRRESRSSSSDSLASHPPHSMEGLAGRSRQTRLKRPCPQVIHRTVERLAAHPNPPVSCLETVEKALWAILANHLHVPQSPAKIPSQLPPGVWVALLRETPNSITAIAP